MKRLVIPAMAALIASGCAQEPDAEQEQDRQSKESAIMLTPERLAASPALSGPGIQGLKLSPDGRRITFLRGAEDDASRLDLWEVDPQTGVASRMIDSERLLGGEQDTLSEAEKARRERNRALTGKTGIVDYSWDQSGERLLFALGGNLHILEPGDVGDGESVVLQLVGADAYETDARFSPAGHYVSFEREGSLYALKLDTGAEIQLSPSRDKDTAVSYGVAEFAAQEELGRYTGYWWAPDDSKVVFTRVDESPVLVKERYELGPDGNVTSVAQRYPLAGTDNAVVDLMIRDMATGETALLETIHPGNGYLARLAWAPGSDRFVIQTLDRLQQTLRFTAIDAATGDRETMLEITSDTWVNLEGGLELLADGGFLLAQELGDKRQLFYYPADNDASAPVALTTDDWVVSALEKVDESAGLAYVSGFRDTPLEQHLYAVPLGGGEPRRLTSSGLWHDVSVGDEVFIDQSSGPMQPPQVTLVDLATGAPRAVLLANALDDNHPYAPYLPGHAPSRFGVIKAADGNTDLHYRMILPPEMQEGRQYPVIFNPYGGPHGQSVQHRWSLDLNQILAREGYIVFILDNRGMWNRGKAFEGAVFRAMGSAEIADQASAAKWLAAQDYIDPSRIGIWGWSYGGYMTLMAMAKEADIFRVGVSVAPVTDWRLYDTAYTERYLGLPSAEGDVYENSSLFAHKQGLKGQLLLIHGMADDNVFFDHSVRLMTALQQDGVAFDLMTYPGKRHGIRGEKARAHLYATILKYMKENL